MYLVIEKNGHVSKLVSLDWQVQHRILDGEIDVIDCETMKMSNGYVFDELPCYYEDDEYE